MEVLTPVDIPWKQLPDWSYYLVEGKIRSIFFAQVQQQGVD